MFPVSVLKQLEICQENVYNEAILSKNRMAMYFWKIPRKTSLIEFLLSNLSCPIYYLQLDWSHLLKKSLTENFIYGAVIFFPF